MKNILLISFALVLVGGCDNGTNPVAETSCTADGCTADCSCGCEGVSGANGCTCATNCQCGTCAGGGCTTDGCGTDCPCGCDGAGGDDCTCSTECTCFVSNDDGDGDDTTYNIWYGNNSSPTINVGDTVTWTNASGTHTVTGDDGTWGSETLSLGGTFEYTFNTIGVFDYHCNFHASMVGTVTVIAQ